MFVSHFPTLMCSLFLFIILQNIPTNWINFNLLQSCQNVLQYILKWTLWKVSKLLEDLKKWQLACLCVKDCDAQWKKKSLWIPNTTNIYLYGNAYPVADKTFLKLLSVVFLVLKSVLMKGSAVVIQ